MADIVFIVVVISGSSPCAPRSSSGCDRIVRSGDDGSLPRPSTEVTP